MVQLKPFPGSKLVQLNHYIKQALEEYHEAAILQIGVDGILHVNNNERLDNLLTSIMKIPQTYLFHLYFHVLEFCNVYILRFGKDNSVLICYPNINILCYKVLDLRTLLPKFLRFLFLLAEANLDEGFPYSWSVIDQYEIWTRQDRNKNGEDLIEYARKGLICESLESTICEVISETSIKQ